MGACCQSVSPWKRKSSSHKTASCPSVNTSASTTSSSPSTRFTGKRPQSTSGLTDSTIARAGSAPVRAADLCRLEENRSKRGQGQRDGLALAVPGLRVGLDPAEVADAAAAIGLGVAVQDLLPAAGLRHADAIIQAGQGGEVEDDEHRRRIVGLAQERDDALLPVRSADPLEAVLRKILFVQGRFRSIGAVQIAHPILQTLMPGV